MLVHPRPGVDRRNLRDVLQRVHGDLQSVHSRPGHTLTNYLNWANEAARMLAGQVSPADLNRLVLTKRYELLLNLHPHNVVGLAQAPINGLLSNEISEQAHVFEAARAVLDRQIERWSTTALFLAPETSFFIRHEQKLQDVDFHKLVLEADLYPHLRAAGGEIHVLVLGAVIDELDRLKESRGDQNLRWRAGYTLAVLDSLFQDPDGQPILYQRGPEDSWPERSVTLELLFDPIGHRRLPEADDEIIDRVVAAQPLAARDITLITYDTGMRTRARKAGLRVIKPPRDIGPEPESQPRQPRQRGSQSKEEPAKSE